ncbi:hypothetical protein PHYBOEH_007893 [Phytophthora boehmeriae]|uniref:PX domain-containing protein n=1 Tax=Phytophthora boehmeriae TaxID=109152 RepID=A0A8T1W7Y2_9STRA|nr:hypothetical protein PHYBOEH_007893 [Phytophthora boehmeriae]
MGRARAASSSRAEQQVVDGGRRPRRGLAIAKFSCAPATGVWYYRVDVSVYQPSTFVDDEDNDDSDDDSSDSDSLGSTEVEHYSVLRRYNEFLQLYAKIHAVVTATEGDAKCLPPFPMKEYFSPALVGFLWRVSSSKTVLEDRRVKFEALLQWIENHPVARNCPAFVEFLGKPPQSHDGYVSLKEYTSPDWLSSLQQVTDNVEGRKRRYSAGSNVIQSTLEESSSERSIVLANSRYRRLEAVQEAPTIRVLGKRRIRAGSRHRRVESPCKKQALAAVLPAADQLPNAGHVPQAPQSCGKRKEVVPAEGSHPRKKQCSLAHAAA